LASFAPFFDNSTELSWPANIPLVLAEDWA